MRDEASILHADLDAFYASVEQLLDPSLAGRPVAVGGGVVLAASYEARACGVRSGMASWRARKLCPALRVVGGHYSEYQQLGDQVMSVLRDFTPLVERISIDEAFLDVGGAVHLFGAPPRMATEIRRRVRTEIGLPISVGVASTKHLAKVASQVAKPDGLVVVEPGGELDFLHPLPVELMWGVGPVTREQLARAGIRTIGELAAARGEMVQHLLGRAIGGRLAALASDSDPRRVQTSRRAHSVGAQAALGRRTADEEVLRTTLGFLADRVAGRLRATHRAGRTVTVRVRFADLRAVTRSLTIPDPLCSTLGLTDLACGLARTALDDHPDEREISLLAVSVSNLMREPALQLRLPLGAETAVDRAVAADPAVDRAVDAIRDKFGRRAVGYATVVFSGGGRVPDEFRALAER